MAGTHGGRADASRGGSFRKQVALVALVLNGTATVGMTEALAAAGPHAEGKNGKHHGHKKL